MYWTAEGKTSAEAGIILGLKERTVNHYIQSAMHKLGASNKTHAVAKAICIGLLALTWSKTTRNLQGYMRSDTQVECPAAMFI